jgi:glycosyltransferase A (GT-A) superfamily protein (DUF2064 family)
MGTKAAGQGMTSGVLGDRGVRQAERRERREHGKRRTRRARLPGGRGAAKLALSLVARALKKLLLLVLAHLLAAFFDYAAHSNTSAAEMREDV